MTEDDTELDEGECLRWCYRHQADLLFGRADGQDFVRLVVPTKHEGSWTCVESLDGPDEIPGALVRLVDAARAVLKAKE